MEHAGRSWDDFTWSLGCTAETIIAQLDVGGFAGRYNFVHRGVDCKRDPFAVVNCARHADACAIVRASHSVGLGSVGGQPCRAAWNPQQQGLAELAAEFRRDSCGGDGPWMLSGDQWVTLSSVWDVPLCA